MQNNKANNKANFLFFFLKEYRKTEKMKVPHHEDKETDQSLFLGQGRLFNKLGICFFEKVGF